MSSKEALIEHLQSGATTTCHAWLVKRKDGQTFGFTDHDANLLFDGQLFKAGSGLTGGALQQSTGLSVDNTEVSGALTDDGITETDIAAGRFDSAEVTTWLLNWVDVEERLILFRGNFGEIQRTPGAFKVELRGTAEKLNQQSGRVYQANCDALLGDSHCRFDLSKPGFSFEASIQSIEDIGTYTFKSQPDYPEGWFERGRASIETGRAKGLLGMVKFDRETDGGRKITMWIDFDLAPEVGDLVRFDAGCDKLEGTCRAKFANFLNFRGFPHVPNSDWIASYPVSNQRNDGGSRQK